MAALLSKSGTLQQAEVTYLKKPGIEARMKHPTVGVSSSPKRRGYANAEHLVENGEDRTDSFVFYDTFRPMQFFFLN